MLYLIRVVEFDGNENLEFVEAEDYGHLCTLMSPQLLTNDKFHIMWSWPEKPYTVTPGFIKTFTEEVKYMAKKKSPKPEAKKPKADPKTKTKAK